jgi:galactitol 2-dehydrogenase (L-tagatose-forming)
LNQAFAGKTAIVSGMSSEFALPLARAVGRCGARLVIVNDDSAALGGASRALASDGQAALSLECSSPEAAEGILDRVIAQAGVPDILVLCPPDSAYIPGAHGTLAEARAVMNWVYASAWAWAHAAGSAMRQRGSGQIVFVTGLPYTGGWRGWGASAAAFAAVQALSQTLAVEWARDNVRVNALVPGVTDRMARQMVAADEGLTLDDVRRRTPQGRFVNPDKLAQALLYLLSPTSGYITGETLRVDGGWSAWGRLHSQVR